MDSFTPTTNSTVNAELAPHREYKFRLFAMLFSDKEKLLEYRSVLYFRSLFRNDRSCKIIWNYAGSRSHTTVCCFL